MRALLIVPPFGGLDRPSLGVHTVQAHARERGHTVDVFYSNIAFAAHIGEIAYMLIATFGTLELMGERVMGLPLGASVRPWMIDSLNRQIEQAANARGVAPYTVSVEWLLHAMERWLDDVASIVVEGAYDVVGFSTTFEQNNGVAVLARKCREVLPETRLVVGGANCDGAMASAMKRFVPEIDVVFSGESEIAFSRYLDDIGVEAEIISSPPNEDLNASPIVDYREFFRQMEEWLPDSVLRKADELKISYESSRGCWWGQKHHCTFCGLNGSGMVYREKAPQKVVDEIRVLAAQTGIRKIEMTDNIMPFSYFGTLIPLLAESNLGLEIFYEQKANISLEKVLSLHAAGVVRIQPGIEALQDDLLRLMKKGTNVKQNVALLRYARMFEMGVDWNLLSGFPGDQEAWYAETLSLLPLLVHLHPPSGLYSLNFDRFSPYFEEAELYGITNLLPHFSYAEAFPGCDYLDDLAYHFRGDSSGLSVDKSRVLYDLRAAVAAWKSRWDDRGAESPPCLEVVEAGGDYMLIDSRGVPGTRFMQQISTEQASVALSFHVAPSAATRWGEDMSVCVKRKEGYIPLACAAPHVLKHFETVRAPDLADAPV